MSVDERSWQFNKSVLECNKYMLENGIASDVTFILTNKLTVNAENGPSGEVESQRFEAHKYVLVSRSPVFHAMLCGDLAEKGDIVIDDVEPYAFQQMLRYIYTDSLHFDPQSVMYIMYAAKKYLLPGLTLLCANYLQQQVDECNVCAILDQSLAFDEKELIEKCVKIIKYKTQDCLQAESFLEISRKTLSQILDSDHFTVPETQIAEACIKWAKHHCEKLGLEPTGANCRQVLGDCLEKIHFPAINIKEFGTIVSKSDVLTWEQECKIFRFLANPATNPAPAEFKLDNRLKYGPWEIVLPLENVTTKSSSNIEYTIKLTADRDILLKGIVIGKFLGRYVQEFGTVTNRLCLVRIDDAVEPYELAPTAPTAKLQYVHLKCERFLSAGMHQIMLAYSTNNHCTSGIQLINSNVVYLDEHLVNIKLETTNYKSMPMFGIRFDFPGDVGRLTNAFQVCS